MTGRLVCLTGTDGSGKTTLSRHLALEMHRRFGRTRYVYGRYKPAIGTLARALGKLMLMRSHERGARYHEYEQAKRDAATRKAWVRWLYARIILVEYVVQLWWKVGSHLLLGRNVVVDRYIYDTVITDIAKDLRIGHDDALRLARRVLRWVPSPDLVFHVSVPAEVAMSRKDDIPHVDYLLELRGYYEKFARNLGMTPVNGDKPLADIQDEIVTATLARLKEE